MTGVNVLVALTSPFLSPVHSISKVCFHWMTYDIPLGVGNDYAKCTYVAFVIFVWLIHLSWLQQCLLYFCVLLQTITLIPPFLRLSHFSTFKGFLTLATSRCNHTILANKHYSFFQHQGGVVHSKPQSGIFHKSLKFGKQPFHIAEAQFWSCYKGSATASSPLLLVFLLALHQLLLLLLFLLSVSTHNHCVQLWELSSCVATYFVHTLALWPFYDIWNKFQHKIYNNPIASISFLQTGCSCLHFVLIHHLLRSSTWDCCLSICI